MKYALLHCSYSAPICVSDIVAVVVAAREVVWGCVNGRRVIDAVRWVVPLRDIVAPERAVVAFVADVAALRDVVARDVVVRLLDRGTIVCDAARDVVVREIRDSLRFHHEQPHWQCRCKLQKSMQKIKTFSYLFKY